MRRSLLYILLSSLFFSSCEKFIETIPGDKLSGYKPKLVVSSAISPDEEIIEVYVGESVPVFEYNQNLTQSYYVNALGDTTQLGSDFVGISNAEVKLLGQNGEISFTFDPNSYTYRFIQDVEAPFLNPGEHYQLTVKANGKTVTAQTTIPNAVPNIEEVKMKVIKRNFGEDNRYLIPSFTVNWKDLTEAGNYYIVRGSATGTDTLFFNFAGNSSIPSNAVPVENGWYKIPTNTLYNLYFGNSLAGDFLNQVDFSKTAELYLQTSKYNGSNYEDVSPVLETLTVKLLNIDESYAKFEDSRLKQNDGNPFVEPTPLYSNIIGGLGFFGSFRSSTAAFKINENEFLIPQ
ncbi:DUF4249 domain-containing protein [Jiulongibacter sediminis]|uniref:DUF4249 domain-containing protein n=1 Tax=Jiulongibacter sediminis TaxID=1605367 RepID=A0A0P7BED3_9BACT|nr:DUF4249 domain-containing protein [Jiulongibacter sediminis]KPM49134.1 hypothetical protein AFM12_00335 [Jiulongibacter sediminis]TBX26190.1 hypothetical protein TK44_00335 [Jiulongibacter sediminis]